MNQVKCLPPETKGHSSLLSPTEKTDHAKSRACSRKNYKEEVKMIEKGLIITGSDAELLSNALSEVKKAYEESEALLDCTQALNALVSGFMSAESDGREKERRHSYFSPFHKRLVLGTIIDRKVGTRD
jgi:hypothetical protein